MYALFLAWYDRVTKTPRGVSTPSIVDFQFTVDSMTAPKQETQPIAVHMPDQWV
jgi:hypothetical protein